MAKTIVLLLFILVIYAIDGVFPKKKLVNSRNLSTHDKENEIPELCAWKRVWRTDANELDISDDGDFASSQVKAKGPSFKLLATKIGEDDYKTGQAIFFINGETLPNDGKLIIRAQFPNGRGLYPIVKLVKENGKELAILRGNSDFPRAIVLNQNASTTHLKDFPCIEDFSTEVHEFVMTWDQEWFRWYVDNVFYVESHRNSFFASTSGHSYSLVVELLVDEMRFTEAELTIHDITIYEQTSPTCTPILVNPAQCDNYKPSNSLIPSIRSGSLLGSLTFNQVLHYIDTIEKEMERFAYLWRKEVIGKSVEERDIVAICLGLCHESKVPQALYTGLHHSREPMSMMNLVFFIDHLILGLKHHDTTVTQLLHARQLWFVLVVNPDGYVYNEVTMKGAALDDTFSGQRKNRRPSSCKSIPDIGVDLNRNYDVCFTQDLKGSSDKACEEDYRGDAAFSEPETQAIRKLVEENSFSAAFNYHSFGKYFNIPFACQPKGVPDTFDLNIFNALAADMTKWNRFKYGQSWKESNLYSVNGETSDWMWNAHGIYAMSPETGPSFDFDSLGGFWPSSQETIHQICEELLHSNYILAKYAGPVYLLSMETWDVDEEGIILELLVKNNGLRASSSFEAVGSMYLNGYVSGPVLPVKVLSAVDPANFDATAFSLRIPMGNFTTLGHAYVVLRDEYSCFMYRISLGKKSDIFQVWEPLALPQCGTCANFGVPSKTRLNCSRMDPLLVDNQPIIDASGIKGDIIPIRNISRNPAVHPAVKTHDSKATSSVSVVGKHKAPTNEKKALLLISLIVLLGMVVALMGMRHAKSKQSSKDEYSMVSKTEQDELEGDNLIGIDSPNSNEGHEIALRIRSPVREINEEGFVITEESQCRVRSPPPIHSQEQKDEM